MATPAPETKVTLGSREFPVRFSYLHAHTPQPEKDDDGAVKVDDQGNPILKYSAQIIIDKRDKGAKAAIDKAVKAALLEEFGSKQPATPKLPLRDGDLEWEEKEAPHLKGCWFFNCSSKQKPDVVGTTRDIENKLERLGEDEIKSGDYGRVTIRFFGFTGKQKGVAAGLNNIQKLKDGESLGGKASAEEDFGDFDDEGEAESFGD